MLRRCTLYLLGTAGVVCCNPKKPRKRALLARIEASDRIVAVNLFNRNAWYHEQVRASRVSQAMQDAAARNAAPCVGTPEEMEEILAIRRKVRTADTSRLPKTA